MSENGSFKIPGWGIFCLILGAFGLGAAVSHVAHKPNRKVNGTNENEKSSTSDTPDGEIPQRSQKMDEFKAYNKKAVKLFKDKLMNSGCIHLILSASTFIRRAFSFECLSSRDIKNVLWFGPTLNKCDLDTIFATNPETAKKILPFLATECKIALMVLEEALKKQASKTAGLETLLKLAQNVVEGFVKVAYPALSRFIDLPISEALKLREKTLKKYNVDKKEVLDLLWLYELLTSSSESEQFDTVVLDPITSVNQSSQLNTGVITKIIDPFKGTERNLFLLHRENEKGKTLGGEAILELIGSIVKIKKIKGKEYRFEAPEDDITFIAQYDSGKFTITSDDVPAETKGDYSSVARQILTALANAKSKKLKRKQLYTKVNGVKDTIDKDLSKLKKAGNISITKAEKGRNNSPDDVIMLIGEKL